MTTRFENFIGKFDEKDWQKVVHDFLPTIHEVDRDAVKIWFRFFPLSLYRYLENAEDLKTALHGFAMQGNYQLKNQIDSSHKFLYAHRFWGETKHAIAKRCESFDTETGDINEEIKQLAKSVAMAVKVDDSVTTSIVLVGLMTLVQTGLDEFKSAKGEIKIPSNLLKKSAQQIVDERKKDDSQGVLGFLKTVDKQFTVTFDETNPNSKFKAYLNQELTSAAAKCNVQTDERCIEGPIPVECTSASCGTCWIGVIGGKDKLTEVSPRERRQMKVFGYGSNDDAKPYIRLACQAKVSGNVSFVIPAWNGVFGKKVYGNVEEVELEPATTSAKKLRETIADVVSSNK
ncbi:MAG: 2Fe-2S iron-sulfur cluster-binding protein [Pyrinomonadaceae bacterium]|jgi:ferredoxin|nr:2Fe-2S iron-sulfur cluster-binding protein [Pyrinomonadaceae bacterium]